MVLNANDDGDISELGLKRIRYCEAAPKTSNMVDKGDETRADERPPMALLLLLLLLLLLTVPGDGCCELDEAREEVDEPDASRVPVADGEDAAAFAGAD